jgi:uncharacterized protein YcbX
MSVVRHVESVWRYPVKSMRGEKVESAFVGFAGVYGDRLGQLHASDHRALSAGRDRVVRPVRRLKTQGIAATGRVAAFPVWAA